MKERLPCIVYLHGNSSSQLEAQNLLPWILGSGKMLFAFDFAGSGRSEGEYISLGYYEKDDLEVVIDFLRSSNKVSMIGLWGRSMGAVTALMHADRDPSLAGLCLDSPFYDLKQVCYELVEKRQSVLPKFMIDNAIDSIRETIKEKLHFDIFDLNPLQNNVDKSFIPAYFLSAKDDELFDWTHAKKLFDKYVGDKEFKNIEGTHNSIRPDEVNNGIIQFFQRCFNPYGSKQDPILVSNLSPQTSALSSLIPYDEMTDPELLHAISESLKDSMQTQQNSYQSFFFEPK